MDRLGTWEVPFTSTCKQTGRSGRRLNNDLARKAPPTFWERKIARHEPRRIAWTPEAKQISDRDA
jgi:hypothetical protein